MRGCKQRRSHTRRTAIKLLRRYQSAFIVNTTEAKHRCAKKGSAVARGDAMIAGCNDSRINAGGIPDGDGTAQKKHAGFPTEQSPMQIGKLERQEPVILIPLSPAGSSRSWQTRLTVRVKTL